MLTPFESVKQSTTHLNPSRANHLTNINKDRAGINSLASLTNFQGAANSRCVKAVQFTPSFAGKVIDGVFYSSKALKLGDKRLAPDQAMELYQAAVNKKVFIKKTMKEVPGYNNAPYAGGGILETSAVINEAGKIYSAANVDFFSKRCAITSGVIASAKAINDLNDSIKAISLTNIEHDRRSLQVLANIGVDGRSRGGKDLQVVTARKMASGKTKIYVKTLEDVLGNVPLKKNLSVTQETETDMKIPVRYKFKVTDISMSSKAQDVANRLAKEQGINVNKMIRRIVFRAQARINRIDNAVRKSEGMFDNAPVSHERFGAAVYADNKNTYTSSNIEFFNNGYSNDNMCAERLAIANAINDGASKIYAIALRSNVYDNAYPCFECLGWMAKPRGGPDLLIAESDRDGKVSVKTLKEYLTTA